MQQVCIQGILDQCILYGVSDVRHIAYILATTKHETGNKFTPVREIGGAAYFIKRYWLNTKVARWLGNDNAADAVKYAGAGYVQITGENMYEKVGKIIGVDLLNNPDLALNPCTAAKIAVIGMRDGLFTGRKLLNYNTSIGGFDAINARRIINGTDKAELIAGYYLEILNLIK